eukprot:TRINITY_DN3024_c0_g2_i1.p2 TRINITY_DN3024_c0_g2~~TRINITY_DN3024_c0_g2_i1.p2  ORF type:complete len:319 (-),score=80.72 TRINITY_DN3024_c0_g2_i1:1270-2226(-)
MSFTKFSQIATLDGHSGWVTSIATSEAKPDIFVSASRDKTVMVWDILKDENQFAAPKKLLTGHNGAVQDCVLSNDGDYVLSASWDKTLNLYKIETGERAIRFAGAHQNDVMACAFTPQVRGIVSVGRDRSIVTWNLEGEVIEKTENAHQHWVSCIAFSKQTNNLRYVTGGWDNMVNVWKIDEEGNHVKLATLKGHSDTVNAVCVSADDSIVMTAGRDKKVLVWEFETLNFISSLNTESEVSDLSFSAQYHILAAATDEGIRIWNLDYPETLDTNICVTCADVDKQPRCISVCWSADGTTLFAGYTDDKIRVFTFASEF